LTLKLPTAYSASVKGTEAWVNEDDNRQSWGSLRRRSLHPWSAMRSPPRQPSAWFARRYCWGMKGERNPQGMLLPQPFLSLTPIQGPNWHRHWLPDSAATQTCDWTCAS